MKKLWAWLTQDRQQNPKWDKVGYVLFGIIVVIIWALAFLFPPNQ